MVEVLWQDIRYGLRMFLKRPGFTAVAVISLALGIGANTAIFSVVNALLLQPLPYPDPDRLAVLWLRSPGINIPQDWPSPGQYIDIKTQNSSFEEISISRGNQGTLMRQGQPERVEVLRTSSNLFHLLGARPLHGHLLLAEDDKPGKAPVAILSHGAWTRLFGSDAGIVGRAITLNGLGDGTGTDKNQFVVAGVLRPDFLLNDEIMPTVASIQQMDVFLPLPLGADAVNRRGDENHNLLARLKPGVTIGQAQADVSIIAGRIREKDKRDRTFTISVVPLLEQVVGNVKRAVLVLLGSVALVLLIACANVANLLLSRATGRQKEVAIRAALGAGWQRLVRQLLTESILLGLMGGAAGLAIAQGSLYVVRAVNPGNIPRLDAIVIDRGVLAFTFFVSILTGTVFGLAPALRAIKVNVNGALKAGGRTGQNEGGIGGSRFNLRSLLVVSELAFSLILLIAAGLLIRSFIGLQSVSPGFNPEHVISMRLGQSGLNLQNREAAVELARQIGQKIAAVPGVKLRGGVSSLPFTSSVGWGGISVEGFTPQPGQELQVDQRGATPDYFRAMEIPLLKGRFFNDRDTVPNAPLVVLIDAKFAQRFWPNQNPIGKQVWQNAARKRTIVGVVGTVKQYGLDIDGRMVVYYPGAGAGYQVARTTLDPMMVAKDIVREMHTVDPTLPVYEIRTMQDRMQASMARQRFAAIMLGAFAAFALILAGVGVYGVMSYLVTQGARDIGVRMALGAQRSSIVRLVVRQGMELTVIGIVAGIIGAAALTRVMGSLLFGVSSTDAGTFAIVPLILAAIALLATYLPARRATRLDPMAALREE
jgi:predicted permease